jgi:hypothetical protein
MWLELPLLLTIFFEDSGVCLADVILVRACVRAGPFIIRGSHARSVRAKRPEKKSHWRRAHVMFFFLEASSP